MNEPRKHHYLFAHKLLPALFYHNPPEFVENLCRGKTELLRFLWRRVGEREIEEESDRMLDDALGCQIKELDDDTTVGLIILPMPENTTEAYYAAIVYRPPKRKFLKKEKEIARYITLECGFNLQDDAPRTALCEWTASGGHLNMGTGPEPTLRAFLESVRAVIAGEKSAVAGFHPQTR